MVFINSEGKFNENSYMIDGNIFEMKGGLSLYVIDNDGERMLIDTSTEDQAAYIVNKMKKFGIFPVQKILLTHSHWDHMQGVEELIKMMGGIEVEVLASEKAIDNLKDPRYMNDPFDVQAKPVEDVTPLIEGDLIDLNGLTLRVINLFGHTMDSIAVLDEKNKNLFVGDAIKRKDFDTFSPLFMPPDFNELALLNTFKKLRDMGNKLNSLSLSHYGIWTDEDCRKLLGEMESLHHKTKESIIKWYNENPSVEYLSKKFIETFIPNSSKTLEEMQNSMGWLIKGLKISGFIK